MQDYYSILELPYGASINDVKAAFRRLAKIHHPDKGGNKEAFERIYTAYEHLSNSGLKQSCNTGTYSNLEKRINELIIALEKLLETLNSISKTYSSTSDMVVYG